MSFFIRRPVPGDWRRRIAVAAAIGIAAVSTNAHAAPDAGADAGADGGVQLAALAQAKRLVNRASDAWDRDEKAEACRLFHEAASLVELDDKAVSLTAGLAYCAYLVERDYLVAISLFHRLVRTLHPIHDRRLFSQLRQDLPVLESKVVRVSVRVDAPAVCQATVTCNGAKYRPQYPGDPMYLLPGQVRCVLSSGPGCVGSETTTSGDAGGIVRVSLSGMVVTPQPAMSGSHPVLSGSGVVPLPSGSHPSRPPQPIAPVRGPTWVLGWTLSSFGVAALVTGIATGIATSQQVSIYRAHCTDLNRCDSEGMRAADLGKVVSTVSPVAFGLSLVSLGLGIYFIVKGAQGSEVRLIPAVTHAGSSVALQGSF